MTSAQALDRLGWGGDCPELAFVYRDDLGVEWFSFLHPSQKEQDGATPVFVNSETGLTKQWSSDLSDWPQWAWTPVAQENLRTGERRDPSKDYEQEEVIHDER